MHSSKHNRPSWTPDLAIAYRKAADYCAVQERCFVEILRKLSAWGLNGMDSDKIVAYLVEDGFIDEERFALAFARGKFRNLHWGKIRIVMELKHRKIDNNFIAKALSEIDEQEYMETLTNLLARKKLELKGNTIENRFRMIRYLAGKGFEPELIRKIMHED